MVLSLERACSSFSLILALVLGAGVAPGTAQEAADAPRPPKSVRGTLVTVNPRNNTVVVKSDEGASLSWRFEKNVIDEARKYEEGARVIVIYRMLPGDVKRVTALAFPGVEGDALLMALDLRGVAVSTGSACTSDSHAPSHVLAAMGVPDALARGAIRFSLGRDNTEDEVDQVIDIVAEMVARLKNG